MPRLRYRKDFDWSFAQEFKCVEESNSEADGITGQSWLSNAAIVASMSDERLRTAIHQYRAKADHFRSLAKLMESELAGRALGLRQRTDVFSEADGRYGEAILRDSKAAAKTGKKINRLVRAINGALKAGLTLDEIRSVLLGDNNDTRE